MGGGDLHKSVIRTAAAEQAAAYENVAKEVTGSVTKQLMAESVT